MQCDFLRNFDQPRALEAKQHSRLNKVLGREYRIDGLADFPALEVIPWDLIQTVKNRLEEAGVKIKSAELSGGAASYVMSAREKEFNDLDLMFLVDFGYEEHFQKFNIIRTIVLSIIHEIYIEVMKSYHPQNAESTFEIQLPLISRAYVHKMIKVPTNYQQKYNLNCNDCWSLISLRNNDGENIEFKFVQSMKRQYEFSSHSFHIILNEDYIDNKCVSTTGLPIKIVQNEEIIENNDGDNSNNNNDDDSINYSETEVENESVSTTGTSGDVEDHENESETTEIIRGEEGECIPCEAGETESDSLQIVFSSKKSKQIEVNDDNNNSEPSPSRSYSQSEEEEEIVKKEIDDECITTPVFVKTYYVSFDDAVHHLKEHLIHVFKPEEIRGGGFLKYCHLIFLGYKHEDDDEERKTLDRNLMAMRFSIDFEDRHSQWRALKVYLSSHFWKKRIPMIRFLQMVQKIIHQTNLNDKKVTLDLVQALISQNTRQDEWGHGGVPFQAQVQYRRSLPLFTQYYPSRGIPVPIPIQPTVQTIAPMPPSVTPSSPSGSPDSNEAESSI